MSANRKTILQSVLAPAVVVLMLAACSPDAPTALSSSELALHMSSAAEPGVPFKANCELNGSFTELTPTGFIQTVTGVCQTSHMGRAYFSGIDVVNLSTSSYVMQAVLTAANGDEVHATITGSASPTATGVTLAGVATITGGSGRFRHASGQTDQSAVVTWTSPTTASAAYYLDGRISY